MIIDLILDRKDKAMIIDETRTDGLVEVSSKYTPKWFYNEVMGYYNVFPELIKPIVNALDSGVEANVKKELHRYISNGGYDIKLVEYINSVNWL